MNITAARCMPYRNEDWEAMVENLTALIEEEPGAFDAYYYLGVAYTSLGQLDEAFAAFDQAILINEEFGPAYLGLAKLSILEGGVGTLEIAQDYP